ncbi:MAG TPA: YafY family protein [Burkholderiaceae bacterium]
MSRSRRLLDLMQLLRRHRFPVSGAVLADELGVSLRTLYRDIATLQQQGASIAGEAGLGYVLKPGFLLPPLMLSQDELEAVVLGAQWVAERGDPRLAQAARDAVAKIGAVLPADLREAVAGSALLVGPVREPLADDSVLLAMRQAIRAERKMLLSYRDQRRAATQRLVWPVALGFFEQVHVLVAWCELRGGFRHFRADRITALDEGTERYPRRRQSLLREWRGSQGIAEKTWTADKN